ncbi:MAG: hypothetical protein U1E50_10545 [Caulobacteraceae bacterium]
MLGPKGAVVSFRNDDYNPANSAGFIQKNGHLAPCGVEDADLPPKAADGPAPAASDAPAETAPASSTDQPRRLPEADKQGTQP